MIRFSVKSDLAFGVQALKRFPQILGPAIRALVFRIETRLVREIKGRVHVITGQLRRSWIARKPEKWGPGPTQWAGSISSSAPYAAAEEFGLTGPQPVRAHMRRTPGGGSVSVSAFVRQMNRPPHPYVRPAIARVHDDVPSMTQDAILGAWKQAQSKGLFATPSEGAE